jgi:hypothetical protein
MNLWMNNPQYLAQVGHFLGGCLLLVLSALVCATLGVGWHPSVFVFLAGCIAAALKEFWYDMKYELPRQTWSDSIMDFTFYVIGGCVGFNIGLVAEYFSRHC